MKTYTYIGANWSAQLTVILERIQPGDVLIVRSAAARELALRALARMRPGTVIDIRVAQIPIEGDA